jgi:FkbM family methyltransferase
MKLIFDIGANIGNFADICEQNYPNAKVILVEAHPDLAKQLTEKYKNKSNFVVLNYAVSSVSKQEIDFYISDSYDEISTASLDWVNNSRFTNMHTWNRQVKVETISVDDLIAKYGSPDLLKVDVENYEYEVFKGLSSKCGEICFEWIEEKYELTNKCCLHLQTIGYTSFGYIDFDKPLLRPSEYTLWESSKFHEYVKIPNWKWGMIWAK